jgi:hypothetical protein
LPIAVTDGYRYRAGLGCRARIQKAIKKKEEEEDAVEAEKQKAPKKYKRLKEIYIKNRVKIIFIICITGAEKQFFHLVFVG